MEVENTEEEVLNQDTQPTEEELYEQEYSQAWNDEEKELEQPNEESIDEVDEPSKDVVEEDSSEEEITDEDKQVEESEKPNEDFAETLKWNKKEIPVTRDELIALAQKGFDAEKKWQDAAKSRPFTDLIKQNDLTIEQLQILADVVKSKNPEALALLAEQAGIDVYDAERKNYKPVVEDKNYELEDVISEINKNEDVATQMNDYISSVPQTVKDTLTSKPDVLRGLNVDMVNGVGQKIMPEVIKQLAINPNQDFVALYRGVGQRIFSQQEEVKSEPKKEVQVASREDKKKVAVSKKVQAPTKETKDDYDAMWEDNDHFNKVLARMSGF